MGSGPNGLAAAITAARAGLSVIVFEAQATVGGGTRSGQLTIPGFTHDFCSAVHPFATVSPFFSMLNLENLGLRWLTPRVQLAHPFDDGHAAALFRSIEETSKTLGHDQSRYRSWMAPLARRSAVLFPDMLSPTRMPRHPLLLARFGLQAISPCATIARRFFSGREARALFGGLCAHSFLPLDKTPSAAIGLILAIAGHGAGWPIPLGGSQKIADVLVERFKAHKGELVTAAPISSLRDLPRSQLVFLDLTPKQLLKLAGDRLPRAYRQSLERFRYGPGVFKVDWALSGPIPWRSALCREAGTLHLGEPLEELIESEKAPWQGVPAEKPFVLLSQPTILDATRAPPGYHIAWAYCHVPHGSTFDMTERIEKQVERFAPGFKNVVITKKASNTRELENENPNLIGGDISGGSMGSGQLFFRPALRLNPYSTPVAGLYICSASTPPGPGVHGMCGYNAARLALSALRAGKKYRP